MNEIILKGSYLTNFYKEVLMDQYLKINKSNRPKFEILSKNNFINLIVIEEELNSHT